jgi:DeoR/GlpR family transcriptional regulator of sugar metabolism
MTNRQTRILEILAKEYRVPVANLAQTLGVSQVTVRKELEGLAAKGFLKKEHGYAVIEPDSNPGGRMSVNFEVKSRIARYAAGLVKDNETIMLESGSCCALLAEELATARTNITIVSNSVFIANRLRLFPHVHVILLGGEFQCESEVMVGGLTRRGAEVFFCDKFFTGAGGFNFQYGFTCADRYRSQAIRDMAAQAQNVVILTESDKFKHNSIYATIRSDEVSLLVTDGGIPPDAEQYLLEKNVTIHKV